MQTIHQLYNKSGNDEVRNGFRHYSLPPEKGVFLFLGMISAAGLREELILHSHVENAMAMAAYMKNRFPFLGIKSKDRRSIFRQFLNQHADTRSFNATVVVQFTRDCWNQPERELHYCGIDLLIKKQKLLNQTHLTDLEWLVTHHSWWDSVDPLATNVIGAILLRHPEMIPELIPRWLSGNNIWLQRCCILFQLKYRSATDTGLQSDIILKLKDHPDFFIRKAIGWVLREYSKTDPKFVADFVHSHQLSPLSEREGLKHLRQKGYIQT